MKKDKKRKKCLKAITSQSTTTWSANITNTAGADTNFIRVSEFIPVNHCPTCGAKLRKLKQK